MRYTLGFVCVLALGVMGCGDEAAAPTLAVVSPAEGSALGGTELTLGGTNFVSGATVSVGGTPATQVIIVSPTAIECLSPPGTPGVVDVAVTTSGGTATLEDAFNYYPTPAVISVEPARGPPLGGTPLTLTGTGFIANDAGTNTVTVGGQACTGVNVVSDTEITCTSPAGTVGTVDVVVTNANGVATLAGGYTYAVGCGNDMVEPGELCDGNDLGNATGLTCEDAGFTSGTLACNATCNNLNLTGCTGGPPGWTCPVFYYGTFDGCDCGCGVLDPDCFDNTVASCEYCGVEGSCTPFGVICPADINPAQNWLCGGTGGNGGG